MNSKTIPLDVEMAARILSKAVGSMLQDGEGVVLIMDDTWYVVHRDDELVQIAFLEERNKVCQKTGKPVEDGQLVWVHNELIH